MARYSFEYDFRDDDPSPVLSFPTSQNTMTQVGFPNDVRWIPVLAAFCDFLSGIYGYDITQKIYLEAEYLDTEWEHFKHPRDFRNWDNDDEWEAFMQWQQSRKGEDE